MSDPLARSPIRPPAPLIVLAGWEVSGRRAAAALTLTDCTPLAKVLLRAPAGGQAAGELGTPLGRARRNAAGVLVVGSGPGEWLLIAPPGQTADVVARLDDLAGRIPGETVSVTDLSHGRALVRLTGQKAGQVLAAVCGIDLSDAVTPDGAAFRSSVAALATDVIRDDVAGVRSYLLHCERSSGQYLFDALLSAGRDLGIEIDGFTTPGI
ncbi:MAG TPA: sarcosine oxidase subunit gamma family protein [Streptosporangiaceae bacterium]